MIVSDLTILWYSDWKHDRDQNNIHNSPKKIKINAARITQNIDYVTWSSPWINSSRMEALYLSLNKSLSSAIFWHFSCSLLMLFWRANTSFRHLLKFISRIWYCSSLTCNLSNYHNEVIQLLWQDFRSSQNMY